MTTSVALDPQSPLETALREVHATLVEMLLAADEQHAAVVARDRARIETVTSQQERLSARLMRAETRRMEILGGLSLTEAIATLPAVQAARVESMRVAIAATVGDLKTRQGHTARLLARSIELGKQTLDFLQRLVISPSAAYGVRGASPARQSILVDSRA